MSGMPEADWEQRLNRLEEATIVNARLINLMEQRMDRVEEQSESYDDDIAELRAIQIALMKTVDRFIQGRQGNGHKQ